MFALVAALLPLPASPAAQAQEEDSFSFYAPDDLGLNLSLPAALPTAIDWGPDDRLYVADFRGRIYVYEVTRNAPGKYSATAVMGTPVLAVNQIPNHNDDGSAVGIAHRLVTGMLVGGTASNPVVYVTSSDPRAFGTDKVNADTNSGVLSRLTWTGSSWQHQKVVQGLPRSKENHGPNGMELSADGNTLYLAQGGLTNQGARSEAFHNLPEYAYSAAILSVDLTHPTIAGGGTCNLPKLGGGTNPCSNPAPWGGNDGATMVKWVSNSPVQVFAPGFRNAYDIVRTEKGHLFSIDNGANSNFGGKPLPDSTAGTCKDTPNSDSPSVDDHLHLVTQGFYGGHPNPTRANPAGNGFSGAVPAANPAECKNRHVSGPEPDSAGLATFPLSTNGITEYTSNKFGGKLKGDLFTVMFGSGPGGNNIVRVDLNTAGTGVVKTQNLMGSGGSHPLSIVALGDDTPFPGVIFVANFNNFQSPPTVVALEPQDDFVCNLMPGSYTNDADGDGYSDQDEIDNGTDPCNAASVPPDLNGNGISDLNDPDDDADGIPDEDDAFARDPHNGTTTNLPVRFDWRPGDNHGGILGLGFTGLMINNQTNYLDQYDPDNMTTFSAATTGLLTIDAVPPGDALGSLNTQQYGFQFGFNVPTATFSANTRIFAPFAGTTPQGQQSMGLQIGTGHQDNYVKVVLTANDGQSRVEMLSEINSTPMSRGTANLTLPGPDYVDLWITIDPTNRTASASYSVEGGPRTPFGDQFQIPSTWLTKPLAAGIISTSRGAPPMSATWEHFGVKADSWTPPSSGGGDPGNGDGGGGGNGDGGDDPGTNFTDVGDSIFQTEIAWLAGEGITKGCNPPTNDRFCPKDFVTRGQMAAFLHRALDDVLTPGDPVEFVDDDGNTFEADIEWLGATGVTKGCNPPTNDRFCPNDFVTRGQMAAFLHRALDGILTPGDPVEFVDDDGNTFEADIEWLGATGVTRGCNPPTNDRFCPGDFVTREQMAAFLFRALGS